MRLNKLNEAPLFTGSSFSLPEDVVDLLDGGDYIEAYKAVTNPHYSENYPGHVAERDLNTVLEKYVTERLKINKGKDVVKFICKSLGLEPQNNPFLEFIQDYPAARDLSKDQWIALNNMYADRIIDPEDLRGYDGSKTEGILLTNDGLWANNGKADSIMKLVRAYVQFDRKYRKVFEKKYNAEYEGTSEEKDETFKNMKRKVFFSQETSVEDAQEVLPWEDVRTNLRDIEEKMDLAIKPSKRTSRQIPDGEEDELNRIARQFQDITRNLTPVQRAQLARSLAGES